MSHALRIKHQMTTTDQAEEVDVDISPPMKGGALRNQPLFGAMLFLTPLVAGLATIFLGNAAGGMAAVAMIPLLFGAIWREDLPPSPYTMLERDHLDHLDERDE